MRSSAARSSASRHFSTRACCGGRRAATWRCSTRCGASGCALSRSSSRRSPSGRSLARTDAEPHPHGLLDGDARVGSEDEAACAVVPQPLLREKPAERLVESDVVVLAGDAAAEAPTGQATLHVAARGEERGPHAAHRPLDQRRRRRPLDADADVCFAARDVGDARLGDELEFELRVLGVQRAEHLRGPADGVLDDGDAHGAGQGCARRGAAHGREPVFHLLSERHQVARAGVQLGAGAAAPYERAAQSPFERLDAPRDRRRGHTQCSARREEAAMAVHGEQDAQVVPRR